MRRVRIEVKSRMLRLGGPQSRLTDHRINKSWRNLEEIMDGKLDKVINALGDFASPPK